MGNRSSRTWISRGIPAAMSAGVLLTYVPAAHPQAPAKKPNILMLMTDDTGWNDFGAYTVKPIYFDSIDNSAYITGKAMHSARNSWIYSDGETFQGACSDIGDDPEAPWLRIAWKALFTSKDTWLGPELNLGATGSIYKLTTDPFEKYGMTFNGAVSTRNPTTSPGRYAGMENGWAISLMDVPITEFNKSIIKYPSIKRFPGGASNDLLPNLQHPEKPSARARSEQGADDHPGALIAASLRHPPGIDKT